MNFSNIKKYMLALMAHCIPRDPHLWVTGKVAGWEYSNTPPMFFDNSKYFFLYLLNHTDEKVYWLSTSEKEIEAMTKMGLPVARYNTAKGLWLTLRAKYFFHHYGTEQIDRILQYGSTQVNFWHGTPLKKIAYDVVPKVEIPLNPLARFLNRKGETYLASTSTYLSENILCKAFDIDASHVLNFGYPRMDVMKLSRSETITFCQKYSENLLPYIERAKGKNVFLYMPTWRDDDPDYFSKANIDLQALDQKMAENNGIFFLKLHPLTQNVDIGKYNNIVQIANDVDIYPFLTFIDYLITDYSSIFFDFLPLDKEIIFIPYDFENYTKNRELYFDFFDFVPGTCYENFDAFIQIIDQIDTMDSSQRRKQIRDLFIQDYYFDAAEKTYKYFKERN